MADNGESSADLLPQKAYALVPIRHRVMHMWPPVKDPKKEFPLGVSILVDNFYGRWSFYGPAMWRSRQ